MTFLDTARGPSLFLFATALTLAGCNGAPPATPTTPVQAVPAPDPLNHDVVLARYEGSFDGQDFTLTRVDGAGEAVAGSHASLDPLSVQDAGMFGTTTNPTGSGYVALKQSSVAMRVPMGSGAAWDTTNCGSTPTCGTCLPISMQNMLLDLELQHPYVEFTALTATGTTTGLAYRSNAVTDSQYGVSSSLGLTRYPDRLARAGVTSGGGAQLDRASQFWAFTGTSATCTFTFTAVVKAHTVSPIVRASLTTGTSDLPVNGSGYGGGTAGNANSGGGRSDISDDGTFVAFQDVATNLDTRFTVSSQQIYRRNNTTGATELVSLTSAGAVPSLPANCTATTPTISGNGNFIAFLTNCRLVAADTDGVVDVYVRDMSQPGTTILASVDSAGTKSNLSSLQAAISQDGTHVVFANSSTTMVDELGNNCPTAGQRHIWLFDGTSSFRVDRPGFSDDTCGAGNSQQPAIDQSGAFIVYSTNATNLGTGDFNGSPDIYMYDVAGDTTTLVSVNEASAQLTGGGALGSTNPTISTDGTTIAFQSIATNILTPANGQAQIYVRNVSSASSVVRASKSPTGVVGNGPSQLPTLSSEGRFVGFISTATNLDPADVGAANDVYVRDLAAGDAALQAAFRVSITERGGASGANVDVVGLALSDNSNYVAFSAAGDLVPPASGSHQVYRAPIF